MGTSRLRSWGRRCRLGAACRDDSKRDDDRAYEREPHEHEPLSLYSRDASLGVAGNDLVDFCSVLEEVLDRILREVLDDTRHGKDETDGDDGRNHPRGRAVRKLEQHGFADPSLGVGKTEQHVVARIPRYRTARLS